MSKKISELTAATTPLSGTELVEIVQSGISKKVAASDLSGSGGGRGVVSSNMTYYVRTDGSNSNDGLSNTSGGAFLTIQKAIDVISGTLDVNSGVTITIQVADGTYTGSTILYPFFGNGSITIQGNSGTPSNVIISTTSSDCFYAINSAKNYLVKDMKFQTTTSGSCLYCLNKAYVSFGNIVFGSCADAHIRAAIGSTIYGISNYSIVGGAAYHVLSSSNGFIDISSRTITLTGTPAFSVAFSSLVLLSGIYLAGNSYSGSATGKRYDVSHNSVLITSGGTLPGSIAGTTATGGQYV